MKFSLVISTIGRVDDLHVLFASLAEQTLQDFEVILVDQSGDDRLSPVVREWESKLQLKHIPMQGRGASRGRNRGLVEATGDIITFPDDDCIYPRDVLENVAKFFDTRPDMGGLTVRCAAPDGDSKIASFVAPPGEVTRATLLDCFVEIVFYVRREALGDVRFNDELGVGAGTPWGADEGPDLALRLLDRGVRVWYLPEIILLHPCPLVTVDEGALRRSYSYSCGRGRLFRLHNFPLRTVGYSMVRSLGGCGVNLLRLRTDWARYYWLAFQGKLRGYLSRV